MQGPSKLSHLTACLLVDSYNRGEEPRTAGQQVGEDKLEPGVITLGHVAQYSTVQHSTVQYITVPGVVALGQQVQRLRDPAQLGVDCLGRDVQDAAVAHSCHTDQNNYLLQNLCELTHIS